MGLAVIHGVVTSHEGVIRVDGRKGVGMTFTIKASAEDHVA